MHKGNFLILVLYLLCGLVACREDVTGKTNGSEADTAVKAATEAKAKAPGKPVEKKEPLTAALGPTTYNAGKGKKESIADGEEVTGSSRQKLLKLVNDARARGCRCGGRYYKPVPPVKWNNQLERAAKKHSRYMQQRNILSHAGRGGSDAGSRISKEGYNWMSYGENVAAGYPTEEAAIKGWLKSKGHCKNIMSGKFKEMGMARSGQFYTQVFGARR